LAELIVDGVATSTDFTPFNPIRLRPLDPARLRAGVAQRQYLTMSGNGPLRH